MVKQKIKAFTLVELLVVVVVLAILATIGFVSYSSYLTGVRDSNRVSQLKSLSDGLEIYRTSASLPLPENSVEVKANGKLIGYQGYLGQNIINTIEYSNGGKDPKDETYFSYFLTKNKRFYQLMAYLEEDSLLDTTATANITTKTSAAIDYTYRYPTVYGKKLGILTDENNTPIQEVASIVSAGYIDITSTTDTYIARFDDVYKIEGTGATLRQLSPDFSCKRLKVFNGEKISGIYKINPDGAGEFDVYCDMKTGGGGWTLVATTADDGVDTWTYNNSGALFDSSTIGSLKYKHKDFKSPAYSKLLFKDMMFYDKQEVWGAYENINPSYDTVLNNWIPKTLTCAFGYGRNHTMTAGSVSKNKGEDGQQQDRNLFFTVYDNEDGCDINTPPSGAFKQHAIGPTWGYQQNSGMSPDDAGLMGWGEVTGTDGDMGSNIHNIEAGDARLGKKIETKQEYNDGDYIMWFVR